MFAVAAVLAAIIAGIAALALWQAASVHKDAARFPPPGKRILINGTNLHILEVGTGSPAVVLEAGIAASSVSWRPLQESIAKFTRVISFDRAGLGWSDAAADPKALSGLVADLHEVSAQVAPFILVGHSFGGLVARAYAAEYPEALAGLILLDPVLPAEWCDLPDERRRRLATGVMLSRRGALLAKLGIVRVTLSMADRGARVLPELIARASSGKGAGVPERLIGEVRKLPPHLLPIVKAQWSQPRSFRAMADYLTLLPEACEAARHWPALTIPLTILSAANATPEQITEWDRMAGVDHIRATAAGHWVHLDEPELVLTAIQEMIQRSANGVPEALCSSCGRNRRQQRTADRCRVTGNAARGTPS